MCIPLFLILIGYFQCVKTISKKFYKGIIPILTSYDFVSIVTLFYLPIEERPTFFGGIRKILTFSANPYSWYVEIYLGLFLIIPFLNILYNGLKSKKQKLLLIGTMFFITGIHDFIRSFATTEGDIMNILSYWKDIYPISYYFIGCYIREYQPKLKKILHFPLLVILPCVVSAFFFLMCHGKIFNWWMFIGSANILVVILSVNFFLFFYNLIIKNKALKSVITDISLRSFEMYLFSYIIDDMIERYFVISGVTKLKMYILIGLPLVFVLSYLLAKVKQLLFFIVKVVWDKIRYKKHDEKVFVNKAS